MDGKKAISVDKLGTSDPEDLRRQQAHLNFTASRQARHAARQQPRRGSEGGEGDGEEDRPKEENANLFNEAFAADTQDITKALALLVAESEKRPPQPATGTGLSEALRKVGAEGEGEGEESNPAVPVGDTGDIRDQLDALVERVKGLRKRTAEAALFLMVYDLRRAQEEVDKLWASVESTRAELAPRKKFSFRNKVKSKSRNTINGGKAVEETPAASGEIEATMDLRAKEGAAVIVATRDQEQGRSEPSLRGLTGEEVDVSAQDADEDKDFNVADLNGCKVTILHVLGALRLRRLTSCRVVCGPVRGPIYVEACKDCVIVAAGRQLRIHDSEGVDFYVLVASGPIIEDCSRLRFAPSGLRYPEYDHHLQAAGLAKDQITNAWEDVKDFKWHRAHKSPNWNIIPETERESDSLAMTAPK